MNKIIHKIYRINKISIKISICIFLQYLFKLLICCNCGITSQLKSWCCNSIANGQSFRLIGIKWA